jgi:O-antigen/teichoic acid export membrane protein
VSLRSRLLSQTSVIFASRLGGAGLIFLTQAAMARLWGPQQLGEYLVIIAAVNIAAVILPLGFETIGTYFAAEYRARGQGGALAAFMRRAYGHIALTTIAVLAMGHLILPALGKAGPLLAAHWLPSVTMAAATAVVYCNSALLVGLRRPFAGFFGDTVFRPVLVAAGFAIAFAASDAANGVAWMLWILALGVTAIAAIQLVWLTRVTREVPHEQPPPAGEIRRWWHFALPWVVITIATEFFFDLDLLLLSNLLPHDQLAVFGVATRVFSIIAFGVSAVYAVTLPELFAAHAGTDRSELLGKIGDANVAAVGVALALFGTILLGGPLLLWIFGPDFASGYLPLAILALALVIRAGFGPSALVLSLKERPYSTLPAIGLGLGVLIGLNIVLVPTAGLVGAAIAALVAQSLWSAAMWLTARKISGLDVSIVPRLKARLHRRSARQA